MNTADVLKLAYQMEIKGMEFYKEQKEKVTFPLLKEIFEHLQSMEKNHAEYIKKQMSNLEGKKPLDEIPSQEEEDKFRHRLSQQLIETEKLKLDLGDYSIIRMAYLIEKDFAEYYKKSAEHSDDEDVKNLFLKLEEWERGHEQMMKEQLEMIIDSNAIDLGFYPLD